MTTLREMTERVASVSAIAMFVICVFSIGVICLLLTGNLP